MNEKETQYFYVVVHILLKDRIEPVKFQTGRTPQEAVAEKISLGIMEHFQDYIQSGTERGKVLRLNNDDLLPNIMVIDMKQIIAIETRIETEKL